MVINMDIKMDITGIDYKRPKKIIVIGSCGSGKTTFSLQLGYITGLPVIHLDKEYWQPGWVEPIQDEWIEKLNELMSKDKWILDGNFKSSLELRLQQADTVIFLDFKRHLCLYRVGKRFLKNFNKSRSDMPEGCNEKIDLDFIKFIWKFPENTRPVIYDKLSKYSLKKIILRTPKEAELFLNKLNKQYI